MPARRVGSTSDALLPRRLCGSFALRFSDASGEFSAGALRAEAKTRPRCRNLGRVGVLCFSWSAANFPSLYAAGADVEPLGRTVHRRADPLDVGVETTLGDLARPRAVVAEAGLLGADVTDGSHRELLEIVDKSVGPPGGQPNEDIRDEPSGPNRAAHTNLAGVTGSGGIQLATVVRFGDIAVDALAGAREEIDALNVYPVPDGDPGPNMYLAMAAARDAMREKAARGSEG